jgi:2-alkenal reductase
MYDPNFKLQQTDNPKTNDKTKRARQAAVLAALLTLTLVLGAFYAPVLWQSATVAAAPARQLSPVPVTTASLVADQVALADLYDAVSPSVVSIQTSVKASNMLNNGMFGNGMPDFNIPGLEIPGMPEENQQQQLPEGVDPDTLIQQGQGTGWIYDNDGHIVTNNHVVEGADDVTVTFSDGTWAAAEVVATDPQSDLAVLKVTAPDGYPWRALVLAEENDLRVGHSVIALGNPYGYANTMTTGIISALGRSFPTSELGENRYTLPDVIQTDAAINPGNSGGPLLNLNGEVVGVNFAIESASRTNSGVGFAIPVSIVERIVPALIESGVYAYPYLGISGTSITPALARELGIENEVTGAYVAGIVDDSPAADAGLVGADADSSAGGDIITAFNGVPVNSFDALVAELVTTTSPGDTATLSVLRDGNALDVEITIGARPAATSASVESPEESEPESEGSPAPERGEEVSAGRAMQIAERETEGMLDGEITGRSVNAESRDGAQVWVVTLEAGDQTATVVIDRASGDVLGVEVQ